MDAGSAPVQALQSLAPHGRRDRVLPDLRDRHSARALTRRLRPPTTSTQRITCARAFTPAVRSPARRRTRVNQQVRLRVDRDAGTARPRISEASHADADDLGEEHGHRVPLVHGKGGKETLVPLPLAVGRAIDHAVDDRSAGPILLNRRARRMDRHCATRRLRRLAEAAVVRLPPLHPHLLRHTYVTTMLDAGVDLRDV
ncbi:tyrosine-type recombinase/integrase [Lentzea sp. NPDC051213]|uniref:tyrosine-type recombinase/integrase n=1 Tax=Lentzea sp. NPDC051213 TaxID=3364126 RepID=UPI003792FF95